VSPREGDYFDDPIDAPDEENGKAGNHGIVIPYWREVEYKWSELARFAYDALSIPAMSTQSRTIEARWALDGDSIEACECQGQWIRRQFA
jgi:hypothetical protein